MKRTIVSILVCLLVGSVAAIAQDLVCTGRALNFPSKKYGISIGNSREFSGVRINFADCNVKQVNGLNITFWLKLYQNQEAVVNGINLGVIPTAKAMGPINIGLLGVGSSHGNMSGITIAGFVLGSGGDINGLSFSGLLTMADGNSSEISGVAISGFGLGANKAINGLAIAGMGLGTNGEINGIAGSLFYIKGGKHVRGIALTAGYLEADTLSGIGIAGYVKTKSSNGLSLGICNQADELHGIQFGLLNYAGNNPKEFRMLPLLNLHFGKK